MADINRIRMVNKNAMMDTRKFALGKIGCDICGETKGPLHMHEIVSRRRMLGAGEEDKLLSFAPEICSLVCQHCHERIAPTSHGQYLLLTFNIRLYGKAPVQAALEAIPERFRRDVRIP